MRVFPVLSVLLVLLTCSAGCESAAIRDEDEIQHQTRRVETGPPSVAKDGRELTLSLQEWMEALGIPGVSVAVINDYEIVWAKGYGVIENGADNAPVTSGTLFQAASISKPITALAVLHYVEEGVFDLDKGINEYLRTWKLPGDRLETTNVTLRRLLAHSAGITPGGFGGYERDALLPGITEILSGEPPASNVAAQVVAEPGTAVNYSGLGYTIVQLALTDHFGRSFQKTLKEAVFDPVGMEHSTFEQVLPDAIAEPAARGHRVTGEPINHGWYVYPELAAAGLWTTPSDLALMAIEVAKAKLGRSNRIISREMTKRMLTQHRDEMGLGFVIRPGDEHGYFSHSGGNQGYRCHFEMFADSGQGVVVMTNSDAGNLLTVLLVRSVAQAYDWQFYQQRPFPPTVTDEIFAQLDRSKAVRTRIEVDDSILSGYVGRYELAPGLEFVVTLVNSQLQIRLGDQPRFPVYPESELKFFYEVADAQITFVRNPAGETVSLILHQGGRDQEANKIE